MKEQEPQIKHISELNPEIKEKCLAVPGWRIWLRSIFNSGDYLMAVKKAEDKELAFIVSSGERGYFPLRSRYEELTGKPRLPFVLQTFDLPSFILEPLTAEEVEMIGKEGTVDSPGEILRPEDLIEIFEF